MAHNEIKLTSSVLMQKISSASGKALTLEMTSLGVSITSQSAAMNEFISIYREYKSVVSQYVTILNRDLEKVRSAVSVLEKMDKTKELMIQQLGV